jgi:hypothetical protein
VAEPRSDRAQHLLGCGDNLGADPVTGQQED